MEMRASYIDQCRQIAKLEAAKYTILSSCCHPICNAKPYLDPYNLTDTVSKEDEEKC